MVYLSALHKVWELSLGQELVLACLSVFTEGLGLVLGSGIGLDLLVSFTQGLRHGIHMGQNLGF